MEFIVAKVEGGIDRLERFEVDIDLSFLALRSQNFTTVDHQAIRRDFVIELQSLLRRGDGRQDGLTIDARFDVGRSSLRKDQQGLAREKRTEHTYSSANIFAARETWSFGAAKFTSVDIRHRLATSLTDDQGDHGGSIPPSRFQALDQFLHLPDLDILLRLVGLGVAHVDGRRRLGSA